MRRAERAPHHDDHRKGAEREDEARARLRLLEGKGRPAEEAEHEARAGRGGRLEGGDEPVDRADRSGDERNLQHRRREHELEGDSGKGDAPGADTPLLAHPPGDEQEDDETDGTLYLQHGSTPSVDEPRNSALARNAR